MACETVDGLATNVSYDWDEENSRCTKLFDFDTTYSLTTGEALATIPNSGV